MQDLILTFNEQLFPILGENSESTVFCKKNLGYKTKLIPVAPALFEYLMNIKNLKRDSFPARYSLSGGSYSSPFVSIFESLSDKNVKLNSNNLILKLHLENIDMLDFINSIHIIYSEIKGNNLTFKRYVIKENRQHYKDSFSIKFNNGFIYDELKAKCFFSRAVFYDNFDETLQEFIYLNQINNKELDSVYFKYRECLKSLNYYNEYMSPCDVLKCYNAFARKQFLNTMEIVLTNNIFISRDSLTKAVFDNTINNYYTKSLSENSKELLKNYLGFDGFSAISYVEEMETMPAVLINGIGLILKYNNIAQKMNINYSYSMNVINRVKTLESLMQVISAFEVSLETALNNILFAAYTRNTSINSYLQYLIAIKDVDYNISFEDASNRVLSSLTPFVYPIDELIEKYNLDSSNIPKAFSLMNKNAIESFTLLFSKKCS